MKKKCILTLVLIFICTLLIGTVTVSAATSGTCGANLTYSIVDGTLTITGTGEMTEWSVINNIPWYSNRTKIDNIVIEEGVTSISRSAFYDCYAKSISIPSTVTNISGNLLSSTTLPMKKLENIIVSENNAYYSSVDGNLLSKDGTQFFEYAHGKTETEYVIPDSVTTISDHAFWYSSNLKSITIPENVTSIGSSAFLSCKALEKINWNAENVADFTEDNYIFGNAGKDGNGIEIVFGDNVKHIPAYAFYPKYDYTPNIVSVSFGNSVTSIGDYAFYRCDTLTELEIPDSTTSIGNSAFHYCTSLKYLTIGSSVTTIGENAFLDCTALEKLSWNAENVADFSRSDHPFPKMGQNGDGIDVIFGENVKSIPANAFCTYFEDSIPKLKSVTFGNKLTNIGNNAFFKAAITELTLPDSVTTIGSSAFRSCTGLTSITLPDSVTTIGSSAFRGCTGLTSITIPDSVTTVENSVFRDCTGLTDVILSEKLTTVGTHIFSDCTGITRVTMPEGVMAVSDYMFYNCTGLTDIVIPNSVTTVGAYAFENCTALTDLTIGTGVGSIGGVAFKNCTDLKKISWNAENVADFSSGNGVFSYAGQNGNGIELVFGETVQSIPAYALYSSTTESYLPKIKSVTIGSNVATIGTYAFYKCKALEKINWNAKSMTDFVYKNYIFSYAGQNGEGIEVIFGENVENIPAYAFYSEPTSANLPEIKAITLGNNVKTIGSYAFRNQAITELILPDSVTTIGAYSFGGCKGLTSLVIPDNVVTISASAFSGCSAIKVLTIGKNVTSILNYAFSSCSALEKVYWNAKNVADASMEYPTFSGSGNQAEIVFGDNVENIPACAFYKFTGLTKINWGNGVTGIGNNAFEYCTGLTSITIPENVTTMGEYVFSNCDGLTDITIPDSVTTIGNYMFYGCSGLTTLTIADNIKTIGNYAFAWCDGLTSITIADNVTTIGNNAFEYCTGLANVAVPVGVTNMGDYIFSNCKGLTDITIPEGVTGIGNYMFYCCTGLKDIVIPDNVKTIGNYAFHGCTGLTGVVISDGVESIGSYAFAGCTALAELTIGSSTTSIGTYAFNNCKALEKIYWNAANVSDFGSGNNVFSYAGQNGDGIEIIFGETAKRIPAYAFSSCTTEANLPKIKSVTIDNVTSVGSYAFSNLAITELTIGESVTTIGDFAFYKCYYLEKINWNAKNVADFATHNNVFSYAGQNGEGIDVIFGENVERIPGCALYSYRTPKIKSVTLGDNIKTIGFNSLRGLTISDLTIGKNVTTIENYAFGDCIGLTSIIIPESVKSIGNNAFYGCTALTEITIGSNVETIGLAAFNNCTALEKINWDAKNVADFTYKSKIFANAGTSGISFVFGDSVESIPAYIFYVDNLSTPPNIVGVTMGKNVKNIGTYAFYKCSNLISIEIPENVTTIGEYAFYNCTALEKIYWNAKNVADFSDYKNYIFYKAGASGNGVEVIFGNKVETIPAYAFSPEGSFSNGAKIVNVIIGSNVTAIGSHAFYYCKNLTSVTMGKNVTSIGNAAFFGTGLTNVYFKGTEAEKNAITVGSNNDLFTNATPSYVKGTLTTVSADGKTFAVKPANLDSGNTVILALYNNGKFVELKYATYTDKGFEFTTDKAYTDAKIMVWEDFGSLKSLCEPESIK